MFLLYLFDLFILFNLFTIQNVNKSNLNVCICEIIIIPYTILILKNFDALYTSIDFL